jgi:hypothetical protein
MNMNEKIDRRSRLLGLLVYFPELRDIVAGRLKNQTRSKALSSLLQDGDDLVIASISCGEVEKARLSVAQRFASDFPVGF